MSQAVNKVRIILSHCRLGLSNVSRHLKDLVGRFQHFRFCICTAVCSADNLLMNKQFPNLTPFSFTRRKRWSVFLHHLASCQKPLRLRFQFFASNPTALLPRSASHGKDPIDVFPGFSHQAEEELAWGEKSPSLPSPGRIEGAIR